MELIERAEQLERELKQLRPGLQFPSAATLEHRLRWLEIVLEEMRGDGHGVYAETPDEQKLMEKLLGHTVYIKGDRITLHSLTADPASCLAGDQWFRSDQGKAKLAIDTVVANAKLLRREGDTIPAAEIANLDAAKITSGRFGLARMPDMAANKIMVGQGAGNSPVEKDNFTSITFIIDGGGAAITTGQKGHLEIPFACTIQQVTMMADQSGSIVVDIWKDTYANFPPTDIDSITSTTPPTISAAQKSQDSTLTGWTTSIAAGDILAFNVDSAATITRVTISLKVVKT